MEATVDGTVKADITGSGAAGDIALTGTKLSADVNVESGDAALNLAVPAILGMTADVIVVDGDAYTRVSLISEKYQKTSAADAGVPIDATDPAQGLKDLGDWLKKPEVAPEKLDDTSCGSKTCYQVKIDLNADELATLIPEAAALGDVGDSQVTTTVLVEKDTLRPASIELDRLSPEDVIAKTRPPGPMRLRRVTSCTQYTRECAITSSVISTFALLSTSSPMYGFSVPNASECINTATAPPFVSISRASASITSRRFPSSAALMLKNSDRRPRRAMSALLSATCSSPALRSRCTPAMS